MPRMDRIGRGNTTITMDETGKTIVTLYSTQIVKFDQKNIILNSGGYHTSTTKNRMNQAANQFQLGYNVLQRNFDWLVSYKGKEIPFTSGMKLSR